MATEKLRYLVTADTSGFATGMKAVGALAVAAFATAIKVSAEFEKQLSKLRAVSGANEKQMAKLEKKARDLGKSTAYTATEVAGLQVELAKLGFTTDEILNASGGVLDLAAGLGATLADAATLTGSTLRAFGLDTKETGRVVDVLAKAASSSALDFSTLTESLKLAAPIAKATNTSIEDTVAILGTLANAGIKGSTAGTGLRKILIELNAKGLTLNEAYEKVTNSSNKLATASDLVGKRAGGALLTMAAGVAPTAKLAKELENAAGSAEKMRITMEDNLVGDWDKFVSANTELGLKLGESVNPGLRSMVQYLTDISTLVGEAIDFNSFLLKLESLSDVDFKPKKSFGKSYIETMKQTQTDAGKVILDELEILKKQYDKFWIDDLIGPQIDFLSTEAKDDIVGYYNSLGANIDATDLKAENFKKTYEELIRVLSSKNLKTTIDSSTPDGKDGPTNDEQVRSIPGPVLEIKPVLSTTYEQAAEWQAHARKIVEAFAQAWNIEASNIGELVVPGAEEIGNALKNSIKDQTASATETVNEESAAFNAAAAAAFSGLGQAIGEALAGDGDIGEKFLKLIGSFMVQFGSALVALGIAEAAWIGSLDPITKIIAGGALIIAGALISSVAKKKPGNKGSAPLPSSNPTPTTTTPQSVQGEGAGGRLVAEVRGQDLRFVLQTADSNYNALG